MKELAGIGYAIALMAVIAIGFHLIALGQAPKTDWGSIGSFIQGIVAIVAAVLTYRALRVAAHSADAAKVSADAAKIAADIAHRSAESVMRIERAYIDFDITAKSDGDGQYLNGRVISVNLGKTPAIVRHIRIQLIGCDEEPPLPRVDEFLAEAEPHVTAIGAGTTKQVRRLRIRIGSKFVLLAAADYTDIFGAQRRATCATLNEALPAGVNQIAFIGAEEWNSAH